MAGCTDAESLLMCFSDRYSAKSKRSAIARQVRFGQMDDGSIYSGVSNAEGLQKKQKLVKAV